MCHQAPFDIAILLRIAAKNTVRPLARIVFVRWDGPFGTQHHVQVLPRLKQHSRGLGVGRI